MGNKQRSRKKSIRAIKITNKKNALQRYEKMKKLGLLETEEDFKLDDFGDPWISCQADINKLVELKRNKTKSSEAQPKDEKNEPIDESDKPNNINQPIDVNVQPIGEIGSHYGDADQLTDEKDDKERVLIEINQLINETNQPIDELYQEECIPRKNICSERFNHEITWCLPPDVAVEAQCSGCLALGAGEQAATMLEECFGIQAAGALLCGVCAARLRDALRFKRAVVASHAQLTRHPPPCAGSAPAAAVIKEDEDLPPEGDACDLSTVDESPDDSELTIEGSDIPFLLRTKPFAQVAPDKIVEKPKNKVTPCPKKYVPAGAWKKKAAKIYYTQLGDSYACNYCEAIVNFDHILTHRRNFHGRAKCPFCVKNFKTKKNLIKHKIDEHGVDDNRCNVCDKSFLNISAHMDGVHKLGQKWKCTECDFESYAKNGRRRHKAVHAREKKFKCQYCDKSFVHLSNCRYHERIHTGDKRKVCTECGQAFVQKASLNYHMAKYHPSVRY